MWENPGKALEIGKDHVSGAETSMQFYVERVKNNTAHKLY